MLTLRVNLRGWALWLTQVLLPRLADQQRHPLFLVTRGAAIVCAFAAAVLAVYCLMLVYAAATFEYDSLPGPAVLSMVAIPVGLGALLCGGIARLLWKAGRRRG